MPVSAASHRASPAALRPERASAAGPRRHRVRRIRRALGAVVALAVPGVGDAPALAEGLARAHDAPYPGPALPPRVAAALVATEDHRFYSEPGVDPVAVGRLFLGRLDGVPTRAGPRCISSSPGCSICPGGQGCWRKPSRCCSASNWT